VSAKSWKEIYHGFRPAFREFEKKHKPTKAPWYLRLIGILFPTVPARWLADKTRKGKIALKHIYKKRVHEYKRDPEKFDKKYGKKTAAQEIVEIVKETCTPEEIREIVNGSAAK